MMCRWHVKYICNKFGIKVGGGHLLKGRIFQEPDSINIGVSTTLILIPVH